MAVAQSPGGIRRQCSRLPRAVGSASVAPRVSVASGAWKSKKGSYRRIPGRKWDVTVRNATDARNEAAERQYSKQQAKEQSHKRDDARVLGAVNALAHANKPATQNAIRTKTGFSGDRASLVIAACGATAAPVEDYEVTVKSGKNTNKAATAFRRPRRDAEGPRL